MNFSKIAFSWILFKKVSDWLVFHKLVTQDSKLLLNEKGIHHGKNTANDVSIHHRPSQMDFYIFVVKIELRSILNLDWSWDQSAMILIYSREETKSIAIW